MVRPKIPSNGPIRYIESNDITKPFQNSIQDLNGLGLEEMCALNTDDKHVLVYDNDDSIYAVIIVRLSNDHLYIDTLEANQDQSIPQNNGASLLLDYMDSVALSMGYNRIILYSLNATRLIQYYNSFGYVETGTTDNSDPDFGKLVEMEKCLI